MIFFKRFVDFLIMQFDFNVFNYISKLYEFNEFNCCIFL